VYLNKSCNVFSLIFEQDRFTSWRRKSEPGFQSYIKLSPSDVEDDATGVVSESTNPCADPGTETSETQPKLDGEPEPCAASTPRTKEAEEGSCRTTLTSQQSVEEIVGNILMQSHEFQRRLEKHQQQRFFKTAMMDSTEEEEEEEEEEEVEEEEEEEVEEEGDNDDTEEEEEEEVVAPKAGRTGRFTRRAQCFVRAVNAYNQRSFRSQYDSFRNVDAGEALAVAHRQSSGVGVKGRLRASVPSRGPGHEKRTTPESFRKPNIGNESKVIRTALRIRESCDSASEHEEPGEPVYETPTLAKKSERVAAPATATATAAEDKGIGECPIMARKTMELVGALCPASEGRLARMLLLSTD
jgi:hypothetical protein